MSSRLPDRDAEWLEADGLGGFASGTVSGRRTRRYHAVLLLARRPPTDRIVLVNGFDAWVETASGSWALSTQQYVPGARAPNGESLLEAFSVEPWPTWCWRLPNGTVIEHQLFVPHERAATVLCWRLPPGSQRVRLQVRPFLSGRDYHSLHHENPAFGFDGIRRGQSIRWQSYPDVPGVQATFTGDYDAEPLWYRQFEYTAEQERGLDCVEDLATPGVFSWELGSDRPAVLLLAADGHELPGAEAPNDVVEQYEHLRECESRRRSRFASPLHRAADAYVVRRSGGKTLIAGYPWFTDWGRDTFIAMRGLCLATGRLDDAGQMLAAWAAHVSEGMLPNRFPDHGDAAEYNAVDASLWFVIVVHEYLAACDCARRSVSSAERRLLLTAVNQILEGYTRGTRYGIRAAADGLLAAGVPGVQLTWMDAKVGDWVVTPRIGKPVEVQALWINALAIGAENDVRWQPQVDQARRSFAERFWNDSAGCLYDVVDVDHRRGAIDPSLRPNQILAVGGLPLSLLPGERARRVVDVVESRLWTPVGLRSLASGEPEYVAHYRGGVRERDGAYHQGTVWPWLIGSFVDAWVRVRGRTDAAIADARRRFLSPLEAHREAAGLGHVSEITDAEPPFTPRGCPFQAWSLGEIIRVWEHLISTGMRPPADVVVPPADRGRPRFA